jgi:hypothetical protein
MTMTAFVAVLAFGAGYAASIYSWAKIRTFLNGAQAEAISLEAKAKALRATL